MAVSLDQVVSQWGAAPPAPLHSAAYCLAEVELRVEADDPLLLDELAQVLGRPRPGQPARHSFTARVRAAGGAAPYGHLRFEVSDEAQLTPADFLLGLESPEFPFRRCDAPPPWTAVAFRGESVPVFALAGAECLFRRAPGWRTWVALFLFQRLMRHRNDAIFFHASSVAIRGRGVMFIGTQGQGKSTTALALACRGHQLLGDENAAYLPARSELIPFRRPVGIKPGPRAQGVAAALERLRRDPEREGPLRIEIERLLPGSVAAPVPLAHLVFLDAFAPEPRLVPILPGREELARMQPVGSSLVNASAARRVFELVRMLSAAQTLRLSPGPPDATAERLERYLAA